MMQKLFKIDSRLDWLGQAQERPHPCWSWHLGCTQVSVKQSQHFVGSDVEVTAGFGSGKGAYEEECEVKSFEAHGRWFTCVNVCWLAAVVFVQACLSSRMGTK